MSSALAILKDEIVEQLKNNKRFRIDGIGTFQMKVGLKNSTDEDGTPTKAHVTDPKKITARNVEVTGVSFIPDKSLIAKLKDDTSTANSNGRGVVGRSQQYERQDVVNALNAYLADHHFMFGYIHILIIMIHSNGTIGEIWMIPAMKKSIIPMIGIPQMV